MHIRVGTKNKAKVGAVEEILADYPHLKDAVVEGVEVSSGVADQPKSLEEIVTGAENRAKAAFGDSDYSIGIESGILNVPNSEHRYMGITSCVIHDGENTYVGFSSAYEFPNKEVPRLIIEEGLTLAEAVNKAGLVNDAHIGSGDGVIALWTNGRLSRKDLTKEALRTALIHLDQF